MKRIFFFFSFVLLSGFACAEDAATTERLNKLEGYIQDLQEDKAAAKKQITEMAKEIQSLREQLAKPSGNYASGEDLHKLAETVKEVDKKRADDNERIVKQIEKLGRDLGAGKGKSTPKQADKPAEGSKTSVDPGISPTGFEYQLKSGDTLGAIVQAYVSAAASVNAPPIPKNV